MTELLDKYIKLIEQKKEKERLHLLRRIQKTLAVLSEEISFKEAYIFGSILKKKRFYYDSDVDIAVIGLKNKDFFCFMARLSKLLGRDVDIIQLEKHRLKNEIMRGGMLWKKRN